jgi:hypothetical protein
MKESSSGPTKDDGLCAEPRLMPTPGRNSIVLGGLTSVGEAMKWAY